MTISADVLSIREIFSSAADLRVPPYQRGFSWEDAETGALISDLINAFELSEAYFLGAIVAIQTRPRGSSDIVDGQQRLTTLTIILAVLRDLSAVSDEQAALHAMIGHEVITFGDRQRWRISLNHLDARFFRELVQVRYATGNINRLLTRGLPESQKRLAAAVRLIRDELLDMSPEERQRFAKWLADEVTIVKVRVSELNMGYKVFLVLNTRGKPLSDHDILKSALFELADFTEAEAIAFSTRWNEYLRRLGSNAFEDMLKQIRFLYDRQMRGEFIDGLLQSIMHKMPIGRFLNDLLPKFVEAYDAVVNGNYNGVKLNDRALRSLCFLRAIHHESWRAPAMKFLVDRNDDPEATADFFARLDRLAYMLQYSIRDRDYRHRRYRRLIDQMDAEGLSNPRGLSAFDLSEEDRTRFAERLRGRFPNFKQRRALMLRLNAACPGGAAIAPEEDATLEHILPRTPGEGSDWYARWTEAELEQLTECIGNFTLLPKADNEEADRADFLTKIEIYFRFGGKAKFALSDDLRGLVQWTPDDVRARRDRLAGLLIKEWEL